MRDILFRGKRKDNGEWVYGLLLETPLQEYREYGSNLHIVRGYAERKKDGWDFLSYLVDEETVGQYTGLTDKNGKKIFEGDIVKREFTLYHNEKKRTRETQVGVVTYSDTDCGFYLEKACNLRKPWDGDTLEVIGNIHDNPELLKGGVDNG